MALTRKFLSAMGIEEEKIDQIIDAHTETTNALKEQRDEYKEAAEKLPAVQKELDDLKKASTGDDVYKTKYDALKKEYDDYKTEQEAKATKAAKVDAYKALLKEVGISEKRIDAVTKVADLNKIELEDGKIKDADKLKESVKAEWGDFIVTTETKGANTPNPKGSEGGSTKTKEEILAIKDGAERRAEMAKNPELFGIGEE